MKHSIKISVMAFAAMFAFNMGANAQFGSLRGLANKAKKAVKEKVNDTKSSVQETATSTVSSQASEAGSEATSSSTASQSVDYDLENISGARQSAWTITSPQSELVANVKYYADRMQKSFSKGYKGLDYEAYNTVRFLYPNVVDVLKSTARSDYDNAVNEPVKMLDRVTLNFLKIATQGLTAIKYDEATTAKYIEQLNFFINRYKEVSNPEAKEFFFDEVWEVLKMRTSGKVHFEGGEAGLNDVLSFLQQNVGSVPEAYKYRYPAQFTLAEAKKQYETPNFKPKRIAQLRAYKELEQQGKYGKMSASANPGLEKKALNEVKVHRSFWGKAIKAWVGPVTSTKKNIHGVVITKYRSVKVLCEDQGYKVIHSFALYEKPADGSLQMTGFGWENGDKDIELTK
jgi:hypothetical protein